MAAAAVWLVLFSVIDTVPGVAVISLFRVVRR